MGMALEPRKAHPNSREAAGSNRASRQLPVTTARKLLAGEALSQGGGWRDTTAVKVIAGGRPGVQVSLRYDACRVSVRCWSAPSKRVIPWAGSVGQAMKTGLRVAYWLHRSRAA